MTLKSHYALL